MENNYLELSDNSLGEILGVGHAYTAAAIRRNNRSMQSAADFACGFYHGFFG
ncbi:hypothetical protein [Bombilactobacillus thymidiniphilus]|uniref:Bacteriocin n=1 Tax=Bombilactobacillus thymidiniphilus TaxID=2923363 RepID=A0ABY4PEB6_9LACO|nr:hypothetical protein [Bombilactobacillus thymidiniphilus]UQS83605.1 hypothetical protein MOO47_07530 [Bombilactobacillus thymidiniphilus]UQS83622.1 hypothetical protein MOO47_07615 [Bombilactobacillus thymidiniphilus]UQS83625.1 hypothetical protein MOO47_00015 [Bombilactobacillus thymidiniphilus]UQS83642.1 hypothetical protein MOO47_00100 [Bombilactobacillus thymidiniphilus]